MAIVVKIRKQRSKIAGVALRQPLFLQVQSRSGDKPFFTRWHARVNILSMTTALLRVLSLPTNQRTVSRCSRNVSPGICSSRR